MVILYRRFETTSVHFNGQEVTETSVNDYHSTLRNIAEERRPVNFATEA
jgi:hypothetical protein